MPGTEHVRSPLRDQRLGSETTDFVVEEVEEAPGPKGGIPLHRHRTEDEAWYVLSGVLRFQSGSREFEATAGSGVLLRHGTAHTFWNPGPGRARYLLVVRPKTARLLRALHAADRTETAAPLYDRFDVDLLESDARDRT